MPATVQETYTPDAYAANVVKKLNIEYNARIVENAVGGGSFVRAGRMHVPGCHITGFDIDPDAKGLSLCDEFEVKDALQIQGQWDWALGNPRFGGPTIKTGRLEGEPAYIGAHHIAHILPKVRCAAFVLPFSWWVTQGVRKALFDEFPPTEVWPAKGRLWPFLREAATYIWYPGTTKTTLQKPGYEEL